MNRRVCFWPFLLTMLVCAGWSAEESVNNAKSTAAPVPSGEPAKVEEAIVRALDYLEGQQHPDGHWENAHRTQRQWATAWAVLAYLANGQTARAGNYQDCVKKGLAYLVRTIEEPFTRTEYGDAGGEVRALCVFTLLSALGQGEGETQDEDVVIICERQVQALIREQCRNQENTRNEKSTIDASFAAGGWGMVGVSYWNTLCLCAARQCGMKIPRIVLDDLRAFWKRHYVTAFGSYYDQLSYTFRSPDVNHGFTLTIPSVIALCLLGEREAPEVQGALETLRKVKAGDADWFWQSKEPASRSYNGGHPLLLSQWYLAMKLIRSGSHELRRWRAEYSARILNDQLEGGGFRFPGWDRMETWGKKAGDKQYGTPNWHAHELGYGESWSEANLAAHAAFSLALPKGYLPAFTPWEGK